jgi:hypothetical protein
MVEGYHEMKDPVKQKAVHSITRRSGQRSVTRNRGRNEIKEVSEGREDLGTSAWMVPGAGCTRSFAMASLAGERIRNVREIREDRVLVCLNRYEGLRFFLGRECYE